VITWHHDSSSETNSVSGQKRSEGALRSRNGSTLERGMWMNIGGRPVTGVIQEDVLQPFGQSRSRIDGGGSFFADLSPHRMHATIAPSFENRGVMWSQS
jgi:hypothetical protein